MFRLKVKNKEYLQWLQNTKATADIYIYRAEILKLRKRYETKVKATRWHVFDNQRQIKNYRWHINIHIYIYMYIAGIYIYMQLYIYIYRHILVMHRLVMQRFREVYRGISHESLVFSGMHTSLVVANANNTSLMKNYFNEIRVRYGHGNWKQINYEQS